MATPSSFLSPKPTFLQVLHNQTCYPYSLESFAAFLERNMSLENLEFWLAVRHYKFYCFTFFSRQTQAMDDPEFDNALENINETVTLSNGELFNFNGNNESKLPLSEATHFSILKEKLFCLLKTFLLPGAEKEINIPQKTRSFLLRQVTIQNNFHPAILGPARDLIFNLMRESAYVAWLREVSLPTSTNPYGTVRGRQRKGSAQSGDSGVGSMEEDEVDSRPGRSSRIFDPQFVKGVIRIKRSLSPLTRGIKEFAASHQYHLQPKKADSKSKTVMPDVSFIRSTTYT